MKSTASADHEGSGRPPRLRRGCLALMSAAALMLSGVSAADASPDTLRRSLANLVQAPVDMLVSPYTAGRSVVENVDSVSSNVAGQVGYAVFAWPGLLALDVGNGVYRALAGAVELVPGIVLFPFEADLPPLYDPDRQNPALWSWQNPLAEDPRWFKWVPPLTPFSMDFDLGSSSAWARY